MRSVGPIWTHLDRRSRKRHPPNRGKFAQVELDAQAEHQQDNADIGQGIDIPLSRTDRQDPRDEPGDDEAGQGRLSEPPGDEPADQGGGGRAHQHDAEVL